MENKSDLEVNLALIDYRTKKYIKDLIAQKAQIKDELKEHNISSKREIDLKGALKTLDDHLQQLRFEGIL